MITVRRMAFIGVLGMLLVAGSAFGAAQVYEGDHLKLTVYAPDWIWQGQNINVLVVAEHVGEGSSRLSTELYLPRGFEEHFDYERKPSQLISIENGERQRIAFANITALSGHPLQSYDFEFVATDLRMDSGMQVRIPFSVKTIRGAMVSEGLWAAILPAAVAAAWCIVFALYLVRHAKPGAWRTASPPVDDDSRSAE